MFIGPDETALAVKFRGLSRVVLVEGRDLALHQALLARCRVLVAGDTGLGHLAALVGVPVVTAAGPTPVRECGPGTPCPADRASGLCSGATVPSGAGA